MTQHINLLPAQQDQTRRVALQLVAPLAVVLLLLAAWWANGLREENQALLSEQAARQELQQTRNRLDASMKVDSASLDKEIEALKPKAQAAQAVLSKFDTLGRQQGFSEYFSHLASVSEPGVWLNKVEITQGGKALSLAGRALDKSAVLRYVKKLNTRFADTGLAFNTLEVTPEAAQAKAGSADGALAVVSFKLN